MEELSFALPDNGRVVLPAAYRNALGLKSGDRLLMRLEPDGIRITSASLSLRQTRALLRERLDAGRSLADELIAERRSESGA